MRPFAKLATKMGASHIENLSAFHSGGFLRVTKSPITRFKVRVLCSSQQLHNCIANHSTSANS